MRRHKITKFIKEIKNTKHYGLKRVSVQFKKEMDLYLNCKEQENVLRKKVKDQLLTKNKVQIGGGDNYLENFINIDVKEPADIIYDVRGGIPLPAGSINFLFAEHFLEHLDYPVSVNKFFSEAYRVIRINGKLAVGVPDSEMVINAYCKKDKNFLKKIRKDWYGKRKIKGNISDGIDVVNLVMRDLDCDKKYNPHYWGYDIEKLESLFRSAGFQNIKRWVFNKRIANPKRRFAGLYLEGTKKY